MGVYEWGQKSSLVTPGPGGFLPGSLGANRGLWALNLHLREWVSASTQEPRVHPLGAEGRSPGQGQ